MVKRLAQTPKSVRLGEQVANLLLAAIRLQEYLPGQRLPSERELCLRLGVNRMAVREGLRWLEHQQYIEIRRGRYGGAFVRAPATELALERLRGHAEHVAIVRALETGSASSTREAMQHHVLESERMIRRAMLDVSAPSDTGAGTAQDEETAPGTAAPGVVIGAAVSESSA